MTSGCACLICVHLCPSVCICGSTQRSPSFCPPFFCPIFRRKFRSHKRSGSAKRICAACEDSEGLQCREAEVAPTRRGPRKKRKTRKTRHEKHLCLSVSICGEFLFV